MAQSKLHEHTQPNRAQGVRSAPHRVLQRFGLAANPKTIACCVTIVGIAAAFALVPGVLPLPGEKGVVIAPSTAASPQEPDPPHTQSAPQRILVHIDGAVLSPGVFALVGPDVRVNDAVQAAGGLAPDALTATINLASPVHDGEKIHIPSEGETQVALEPSLEPTATPEEAISDASASPNGLININTASTEELQALPGVGPTTAQAIVDEREANGPFASPDDIKRVSGIGDKKYEKMAGRICV